MERRPIALVAEDDPEMRGLVTTTLRRQRFEVVEVNDAVALRDALLLGGRFVDLVVSDVRMPGGNGLDVIERHLGFAPRAAVIVTTAFGDDVVRARAMRIGAVLLDKPFPLEALRLAASTIVAA